jgi:hypothetical protein
LIEADREMADQCAHLRSAIRAIDADLAKIERSRGSMS